MFGWTRTSDHSFLLAKDRLRYNLTTQVVVTASLSHGPKLQCNLTWAHYMNYKIVEYCNLPFITEMSEFHTVVNQNQIIAVVVY